MKQWYDTVDNTLRALAEDESETLVEVADDIANAAPLSHVVDVDVSELRIRLDQLSATVGERIPADVDRIGVVPGDRHRLNQRLANLVEQDDLDITVTDSGVIVR